MAVQVGIAAVVQVDTAGAALMVGIALGERRIVAVDQVGRHRSRAVVGEGRHLVVAEVGSSQQEEALAVVDTHPGDLVAGVGTHQERAAAEAGSSRQGVVEVAVRSLFVFCFLFHKPQNRKKRANGRINKEYLGENSTTSYT